MAKQVQEAYIVAATRTPIGRSHRGFFRNMRPDDLLATTLKAALAAAPGLDPAAIEDIICGCAIPEAQQGLNVARIGAVLRAADALSVWRKSLPAGRAWGMAFAESFGTRVCQVVEISTPTASAVTVHRVTCVVDCGTVVNPDSVEAQMQGGILHGLNAALWGQTTFVAGKAAQTNFNKTRFMRLKEMPQVTVHIVASTAPPAGVGEPGVPPIAPALANAYARLTGLRKRALPLFPSGTMGD